MDMLFDRQTSYKDIRLRSLGGQIKFVTKTLVFKLIRPQEIILKHYVVIHNVELHDVIRGRLCINVVASDKTDMSDC